MTQSAFLMKPNRWALRPGMVSPRFTHLWKDLVFAVPLWEGGSDAIDLCSMVHGTMGGTIAWSANDRGMASNHTGNDYFSFGTNPGRYGEISITNEFTIECVHHVTDNTAAWQSLFMDWVGATNSTMHWAIRSGKLSLFVTNNGTATDNLDGLTTLSTGTTYHLCHTFDNGAFNVYLDGIKDANQRIAPTVTSVNTGNTHDKRIGTKPDGSNPLRGKFSYLLIHKRALTSTEVLARANDPFGPFRMDDDYAAWRTVAAPGGSKPWFFQNQIIQKRRAA